MANRRIRKTAILAKIESVYKTDPVPTGAANSILVSDLEINPLNSENVDRDLVRAYLGGSEQLVGTAFLEMGFTVELQGAGAAGTAPAWGPLMRACGFAETVTAGNRVEYNPISDSEESVTIYWYDDGVLHKGLGCRGSFELEANIGQRPVLRFRFVCIDGGISAAANPSQTLTGWIKPLVVTDTNTGDVTLGCTYSAGALSSGTAYPSSGITISSGIVATHTPMLGQETVEISDREVTGAIQLDLTAAEEVTFMGTVKANTTQSLGLVHGTTAGQIVVLYAPVVQLINPTKQEINGKRIIGYDLRMVPSIGNDELKIVAR
jgi:hypothetical protein